VCLLAVGLAAVCRSEPTSAQSRTVIPTVGGGFVLHVPGEGSTTVARLVGGGAMIYRPQSGTQILPPPLRSGKSIGVIAPIPVAVATLVPAEQSAGAVASTAAAVPSTPVAVAPPAPAPGSATTFVTTHPDGEMTLQTVRQGTTEVVRIPGGYTLHRTADGVTVVVPPGSCRKDKLCR
jgi:hypothetical protein